MNWLTYQNFKVLSSAGNLKFGLHEGLGKFEKTPNLV